MKLSTVRVAIVIAALLILALGVWSVLGLPVPILLAVVGGVWFIVLRARYGGAMAVSAVVIGELLGILGLMMVTAVASIPMLATVEIGFTVAGLLAGGVAWRSTGLLRVPGRAVLVPMLTALAGGVVWSGALALAQILPNAAKISWVMLGDSANNVLLAREVLRASGVAVGANTNPVPLPAALLALFSSSGRGQIPVGELLRHDITALVVLWSVLIVLGTLAAGLTAGALIRAAGGSVLMESLGAGGASLLPLSWFMTGNTVDYGFLDAQLAIPLVLLAVLAFLSMTRSPVATLAILLAVATLLLAVWSPLVLIPGALGAVLVVRDRRRLRSVRGLRAVLLGLAFLQLLLFGFGVSLPNLLRLGGALTTGGAVYPFHKWMIAVLMVAAIVFAVVAFRKIANPVVLGTIAVVFASVLGLGLLLFGSRNMPTPWTYYPEKFSWLCATVLLVFCVGLAAAVAARFPHVAVQLTGMVAIAVVAVGFLLWVPRSDPGVHVINPVARVVSGNVFGKGDVVADRILDLTTPKRPVIFWQSNDEYQDEINFWDWEMWADSLQGHHALRLAGYAGYDHKSVPTLCRIIGLLGGKTTVYTAQHGLQAKLTAQCPDREAKVVFTRGE